MEECPGRRPVYAQREFKDSAWDSVSLAALVAFFIDYFKLKRPKLLVGVLIALPVASLAAYLISRNDVVAMNKVFNLNLLFVQASILFVAFVSVRAVARGDRGAIPILVGVVLGVGFGTHDVIYAVMDKKPFAWLQGFGFFSMNISLFITLTQRSARLYKELREYSKDIEDKTRQLSTYLERIEKTADSVSAITAEIDADAGTAAASADSVESTADFARGLDGTAEQGRRASRNLDEAISMIKEAAGEIKNLAVASAERTVRIRESVSDIVRRIENGVQANAEVALKSILSVSDSLSAQRAATDKLRTALESLSASASSIRSEAERQDEDGRRIGSRMAELVALSNELRESIAGIARENAAIADTTKRLATVSRDGKDAVSGLRLLLESRRKG